MTADDLDLYVSAFARRCAAMAGPGQTVIDRPGACGVLGSTAVPRGRLLISDDRALPLVEELAPDLPVQILSVLAGAHRCRDVIERGGGWRSEDATAMVCRDLSVAPTPNLPEGLTLRTVRRAPDDSADGVPLRDAAQAAQRADPQAAAQPLDGFVEFLRSLPAGTRLLAAVDEAGDIRATAGASALGEDANAYFVTTDPTWRHRGVATAMTAAALTWARESGAQRACLDASTTGLSIYLRLGFEAVSESSLYARFG